MLPLYHLFHSLRLYTNYSHKIQFITFVLNKICHLLGQLRKKNIILSLPKLTLTCSLGFLNFLPLIHILQFKGLHMNLKTHTFLHVFPF